MGVIEEIVFGSAKLVIESEITILTQPPDDFPICVINLPKCVRIPRIQENRIVVSIIENGV